MIFHNRFVNVVSLSLYSELLKIVIDFKKKCVEVVIFVSVRLLG